MKTVKKVLLKQIKKRPRLVLTLRRRLSWLEWGFFTLPVIIAAFVLLYYGVSWKVLAFAPLIVAILCLISVIEAARGGIKGAHRYKNREKHRRQKPHAMNRIVTTVLTILICIPVGILSFVPLMQAMFDENNLATEQQRQASAAHSDLKRYQYMLCTDGSYRSYTDEQMKDPNTGLTSESEDYCKKNGQGKMLRLTNSLEEAKANGQKSTTSQQYIPTQKHSDVQSSRDKTTCRSEYIFHDYINKSSDDMATGESKVTQEGVDGERVICRDRNGNITKDEVVKKPVDEIYVYGTAIPPRNDYPGSNSHSCGYYASLGLANSTYAAGCTP